MPNFVVEKQDSPDLSKSSSDDKATIKFNVYGMTDPAVAHLALIAQAPASVVSATGMTLVANNYRVTGVQDNLFNGEVRYDLPGKKRPTTPDTNETRISFTIGATNQHIEKSLATVKNFTHDPAAAPPDFQQLIGVTKDGVQGTDILVPEFTFEITKYVPLATVTDAWVKQVANVVGTIADKAFMTFPVGEILLTSVSGASRSDTDAELTFAFARSPNVTLNIGTLRTFDSASSFDIEKLGWEYLWIYYEPTKDETAKRVVRQPKFAYLEQVYYYGDYDFLGLT